MDTKHSIDGHCDVQVALRIRPLNAEERKADSTMCVELTQVKGQIRVFQSDKSPYCQYFRVDKHFIFDQLFPQESDQEEIFEGIGMPMVKAGMDGFKTCIFCYGMTGSGKTFSMTGSKERPGLSSRIFSAIFQCIDERKAQDPGFNAEISVSYIEIYNENLKDLLGKSAYNRTLEIRENAEDGVHVKGLTECKVSSLQANIVGYLCPYLVHLPKPLTFLLQDLKKYKEVGDSSRKIACHKLNDQSSRSHTIFTIRLRLFTTSMITGQTTNICGKINLVDLAVREFPCDFISVDETLFFSIHCQKLDIFVCFSHDRVLRDYQRLGLEITKW